MWQQNITDNGRTLETGLNRLFMKRFERDLFMAGSRPPNEHKLSLKLYPVVSTVDPKEKAKGRMSSIWMMTVNEKRKIRIARNSSI